MVIIKLANKYRPRKFNELLGQDTTKKILSSIVLRHKVESAYTFGGPSGTGKTTLGRMFSQMILCSSPTLDGSCGICESCKLFIEEKHFGYKEMDAATFSSKEDMISLRDNAVFQPVGDHKIILLDECHDISKQGQDSLLNQLEDCPPHLTYIFCTTNPNKMEKTLRDRCMEFSVHSISSQMISDRLELICKAEGIEYDREALFAIADNSDGSVRNAIQTLEKLSYMGKITTVAVNEISRVYDSEIYNLIIGLSDNVKGSILTCKNLLTMISDREIYNQILWMLTDAAKVIYGYKDLSPARLAFAEKLMEKHGLVVIELLGYLLQRDKQVDRIGILSDLMFLHYKFGIGSFVPPEPKIISSNPEKREEPKKISNKNISSSDLYKMDVKERNRVLRERGGSLKEEKEAKEKIPTTWPLEKEERIGEDSFDKEILSPQEFSQRVVGGRLGKH